MAAMGQSAAASRGIAPLIARRIASAALTLLLVSIAIFLMAALLPGDVAQETLGQSATAEQVAALRRELGLDQPLHQRYFGWLAAMLAGDPGQSMVANLPVAEVIAQRLPNSLLLGALCALVAVPAALAIGIVSAMGRGGRLDRALNIASLSMVAMPEFLVATLAVLLFSVKLQWLPSIALVHDEMGWGEYLRGCALPIVTLSVVVIAQMARMTRAAIIDQMDRPYVEMARLKGLGPVRIVLVHILPNAIAPIINAIALSLSYLLGGAIIVETIFNYPGLASLMVNAVTSRDMPLLQACAMIFCLAYLILMLIADVTAILANPRLRAR